MSVLVQIYHPLVESESLSPSVTISRTEQLWFRRWRWLLNLLMPSCSLDSNRCNHPHFSLIIGQIK